MGSRPDLNKLKFEVFKDTYLGKKIRPLNPDGYFWNSDVSCIIITEKTIYNLERPKIFIIQLVDWRGKLIDPYQASLGKTLLSLNVLDWEIIS